MLMYSQPFPSIRCTIARGPGNMTSLLASHGEFPEYTQQNALLMRDG